MAGLADSAEYPMEPDFNTVQHDMPFWLCMNVCSCGLWYFPCQYCPRQSHRRNMRDRDFCMYHEQAPARAAERYNLQASWMAPPGDTEAVHRLFQYVREKDAAGIRRAVAEEGVDPSSPALGHTNAPLAHILCNVLGYVPVFSILYLGLRSVTPLHLAAEAGHKETVQALLMAGANLHAVRCCCIPASSTPDVQQLLDRARAGYVGEGAAIGLALERRFGQKVVLLEPKHALGRVVSHELQGGACCCGAFEEAIEVGLADGSSQSVDPEDLLTVQEYLDFLTEFPDTLTVTHIGESRH